MKDQIRQWEWRTQRQYISMHTEYSKELLGLEGRKGKMILNLERCLRVEDGGPELSAGPSNLHMPSKSPALTSLSIPTHPYSVCLRPSGSKSSCPLSLTTQTLQEAQDPTPGF